MLFLHFVYDYNWKRRQHRLHKMLLAVLFYLKFYSILNPAEALVNLALDKKVQYCEKRNLSSKLVDGVTEAGKNDEIITIIDCKLLDFVEVNLGIEYFIHYVIIYEGMPRNPAQTKQLDHFRVDLVKVVGIFLKLHCGVFPWLSFGPNQPMRVNCAHNDVAATYVKVTTIYDYGLSLAEMEVYTLGVAHAENVVLYSRGCFKDFASNSSRKLDSLLKCQQTCRARHFTMAIKNNETCYCGYNYNQESKISLKHCQMKCNNPFFMCGGPNVYSVYIVRIQLPSFYGCIDERYVAYRLPVQPQKILNETMLPGKCIHHCADKFTYALFKDNVCACLNITTGANPADRPKCNRRCTSDNLRTCGGETTFMSVYKTCMNETFGGATLSCYNLFRCDGRWDEYGFCDGKCEDNFGGEYCLEEVPNDCSYGPCESENNTICKLCEKCQKPYVCECAPGFEKSTGACIPVVTTTTEPSTTTTTIITTSTATTTATTTTTTERTTLGTETKIRKSLETSAQPSDLSEAIIPQDNNENSMTPILLIVGIGLLVVIIIAAATGYWKRERLMSNKVGTKERDSTPVEAAAVEG